jgi:hypothetical protein
VGLQLDWIKLLRQARQESARCEAVMPSAVIRFKFESGERRVDFVELQILDKIHKKAPFIFPGEVANLPRPALHSADVHAMIDRDRVTASIG